MCQSCGQLLGLRWKLCISCFHQLPKKGRVALIAEAMTTWPKVAPANWWPFNA